MASSLSDRIAGILNAAPDTFDPEDDINEETTARVVSKEVEEDSDEEIVGTFRKQNVELLEDVDQRYKGKRASRKRLREDDWSSDDDGDDSDHSAVSNPESDVESHNQEDEESLSDIEEDEDKPDLASEESDRADFTHIEEPNLSEQVQKGQCIRQQLNVWENVLEMRIQFQKCLIASNKLPPFNEINNNAKLKETKKSLTNLLDKLMHLQLLLVRKYPETKSLFSSNDSKEDDEEIPSDTEEEEEPLSDSVEMPNKKKRKLNYAAELGKRHALYKTYRDSVIQKWNDKTRIASNKTGNVVHSVLNQIEHVLTDKKQLVKRTQLCRNDCNKTNGDEEIFDPEIFDDTDFYHQLLRQLIEHKSADLTDPVQLGRQWIQLQNLRSKMKRKIDTRATKGRKIRYAVHSKLVNFMAPIEDTVWQEDAKKELYNSLFGKCK